MSANADKAKQMYANGVYAATGLPLGVPPSSLAGTAAEPAEKAAKRKMDKTRATLGADVDDENDLAQTGWAVVFPAKTNAEILKALEPLLARRREQAGDLYKEFTSADGYRPGETCDEWLDRHGVQMATVDPSMGVPFYLLLVGSPDEIPFGFQTELDVFWAVGRLHFDPEKDGDDATALYRRYAESVVDYETGASVKSARTTAVFATCHPGDDATEMLAAEVAVPLAMGDEGSAPLKKGPIGQKQKFGVSPFIADAATKETLTDLLRGKADGGPPALLFSGSHGMVFDRDDAALASSQGALLCQDWEGFGKIRTTDYFTADDVPDDAAIHGMIHFFFACFGAGCPKLDTYPADLTAPPDEIAPSEIVARLPQRLLTHPKGGALAALGHVDRAWTYSFRNSFGVPQLQGFRDVMGRLLGGNRIGVATDRFDVRRAALSMRVSTELQSVLFGKIIPAEDLSRLIAARNDARDYIVLGDPAVRIRVEDIPEA